MNPWTYTVHMRDPWEDCDSNMFEVVVLLFQYTWVCLLRVMDVYIFYAHLRIRRIFFGSIKEGQVSTSL